jgi:hypothetical protein
MSCYYSVAFVIVTAAARGPKQSRFDSLRLVCMDYYLLQGQVARTTLHGRVYAADSHYFQVLQNSNKKNVGGS